MSVLNNLEPKKMFSFFEDICAIPHGSGNVTAISNWLVNFAESRNLRCIQDDAKNVVIFKNASKGYENSPTVILQSHMDMVCEKAPDCDKNMETDGLDLIVDGDFISANGTTLGGDDGIAVAMALAILDSDLPSPALEVVITTDEEIGMNGAFALDTSVLSGKTMINIDSEDEGVFTVSCAGGNITKCKLPITTKPNSEKAFKITVEGLTGGHSGVEIIKGRANANALLARLLLTLSLKIDLKLSSFNGGKKDNAIPVLSESVVVADEKELREICETAMHDYRNEYSITDPELKISVKEDIAKTVLTDESCDKVISMLNNLPNGIYAMSPDIEGLVQTSLNMGIVITEEDYIEASFCVRSSIATQKTMLTDRMCSFMKTIGGSIEISGDYPGWQYRRDSALRDLMSKIYKEQTLKDAKIEAIHAGVECGLFAGRIKDLDCISIGPDLYEIHTFRERLSISSAQRTYNLVTETLKRLK